MCKLSSCIAFNPVSEQASYEAAIKANPDNAPKHAPGEIAISTIANHTKLWPKHRWLTIAFIDNPPEALQDAIEQLIWQWDPHVSLIFGLSKEANADIRISTNTTLNGSSIGTDALTVEAGQPTMYIGLKPSDPDFKVTVLHEFGHALGLEHEHQHPQANIPWNKPKVYKAYATQFGWDKELVDDQLFTTKGTDSSRVAPYDKTSIMHYPVDKEFTDGIWEVGTYSELSEQDIKSIGEFYPKKILTDFSPPDSPSNKPNTDV